MAGAGKETVNHLFGTRIAVLVGDFLFAQASWNLAQLENLEVWEGNGDTGWQAGPQGAGQPLPVAGWWHAVPTCSHPPV